MKIGFAMCGSFCTFSRVTEEIARLVNAGYDVLPILSQTAYTTDTRFGTAQDWIDKIETICKTPIIHTIAGAEPIGPKALLDALVIAPCTGNTLAKLACGITDSSVTMAAKAHLRNERPVVVAVSTNDGLGLNAKNIGTLSSSRHFYFVPFGQDDPQKKTKSLVADMTQILPTLESALVGVQLQPMLI